MSAGRITVYQPIAIQGGREIVMNYRKLGVTLRNARIAAHLSQAQVSEYINKTSQNISSWELGKSKIDIDSFEKLCHLYNIPFAETLRDISDDSEEEYGLMSDEDVIQLYKKLDVPSKSLIKHTIHALYRKSPAASGDR